MVSVTFCDASHYLRLVRGDGEKLKKCKDIFDFAYFCGIIYSIEYNHPSYKETNYEINKLQ